MDTVVAIFDTGIVQISKTNQKKRLHPAGIEPTTLAWKANILPLNYGCFDPCKRYLLAVTTTL
jgi:hypothetical protein